MAKVSGKKSGGSSRRQASLVATLKGWLALPAFWRGYAYFGAAILFITTLFWTILGAHLQQSNADQLTNPYLFNNTNAFHGAQFPGQHSFLIKWPLFYLIRLYGYSPDAYIAVTLLSVLATVAALVWIFYKVDRRPLVFGTLCLALSSVLLLIPAQPYSGALLPVNMAMLANRNLEYILYIASLMLIVRSASLRRKRFWLGAVVLLLLVASDKLFMTLSIGGALIALVFYSLASGWNLVGLSVRWLVGGLAAALGATTLLWAITAGKLSHIAAQASAGPYGIIHSIHQLVVGGVFALTGLLTNFGANPAYDSTVIRNMPHQALTRLLSSAGPAYLINLIVLGFGLYAAYRLIRVSLTHNHEEKTAFSNPAKLALTLIWTSLAALIVFVATDHYYAVDARYLTIALFAVFISMSVYMRNHDWPAIRLVIIGGILFLSSILGLVSLGKSYSDSLAALQPIDNRNRSIANILSHHKVNVLIGDYWRVVPIKFDDPAINITPMSSCSEPRGVSVTSAWQTDITHHSFAYLLSLDHGLTDYQNCSISQITDAYGKPNASALIAGTLKNPKELLLFYDLGSHKNAKLPPRPYNYPSTVLPITLDELANTSCSTYSVLNVVAHEDDDILFMNPDLAHDIQAGHCVRTIYVTAGDAGLDTFYWVGREQGAEFAYSKMMGTDPKLWIDRIVTLNDHEFVTIASPRGNPKISLIFMHLPDGNPRGTGFPQEGLQSLAKLDAGTIKQIKSVDGQSYYSSTDLVNAIASITHAFQPAEVRTQSNLTTKKYPDHSDHMAVGRFAQRAYNQYESVQFENKLTIPLDFYIGYPIQDMAENVTGSDLQTKEAVWDTYNDYDPAACQVIAQCLKTNYGAFFKREYRANY